MKNKIKIILFIFLCTISFFGYVSLYMPNDPLLPQQWAIRNTGNNVPGGYTTSPGCDMDVDSAWNITLGSNKVLISLVDSGVDTLHEDLIGNLVPGYNFMNDNTDVSDIYGHGTCSAGIIGALGNNNKGVSGISPLCKIMPIKLYNSGQDSLVTDQMITDAVAYSWENGQWISVLEFAWDPLSNVDTIIADGVRFGRNGKGTIFVCATGNTNTNTVSWPASHPDVISVGGINPCNQRKYPTTSCGGSPWGANYGVGIDIVAPCVRIYTTDLTGSAGFDASNYYSSYTGTSSAIPNVAGVCALMLAKDSTLRWDSVRSIICRTAEKVGAYNYNQLGPLPHLGYTWNPEMGYGKINAYYALLQVVAGLNKLSIDVIPEGFYNAGKLNMKDTIKVYLRSSTSPYSIIDSAISTIDSNIFRTNLVFTNQKPTEYYIVLKHRNSIETWSNIHSDNNFYSFVSEQNQAYGENLTQVDDSPLLFGIYSGDVNQDGLIDLDDLLQIYEDATNYVTGYTNTDLTGDKITDMDDYLVGFQNANNFVSKETP